MAPPINPQNQQSQQSRPIGWGGYAVLVVLLSIGGAGVIYGVRPPKSDPPPSTDPPIKTAEIVTSTATTEAPRIPSNGERMNALVVNDKVVGKGAMAQSGDKVKVHYVGTLEDGKEFDSSIKHGQPFEFELGKGRVIKGWDQGVAGMKIGGKRKLIIPASVGYGARGMPPIIPANATLVFDVELLGVERNGSPAPSSYSDGDPLKGVYTLGQATQDLPGSDHLMADIETGQGKLTCQLYSDKAPLTVANFVGLATGKRVWKDPTTLEWANRPAYDGTTFHRIIKGFMVQGGDPKGTGTGEPGYTFPDEIWSGAAHDRAGLLCMANRGANTNGAQFFITDAAAAHLDKGYTIFGECSPLSTVHDIAGVPTSPGTDKPISKIAINRVSIWRAP